MIRILTIGLGRPTEVALLQYFKDLTGVRQVLPAVGFERCNLVIVADDIWLRSTLQQVASSELGITLWMRSSNGALFDISKYGLAVLSNNHIIRYFKSHEIRRLDLDHTDARVQRSVMRSGGTTAAFAYSLRYSMLDRNGYAAIRSGEEDMVYCDFATGTALVNPAIKDTDLIVKLLSKSYSRLSLRPLDSHNFELASQSLTKFPLMPIVWNLGLKTGVSEKKIHLLPPLNAQSALRLRRSPDYWLLEANQEHFRFSSLLLKRAFTVERASQLLETQNDEITLFFNAAYLCGYAEEAMNAETDISPTPSPKTKSKSGLRLAAMWRSLRFGKSGRKTP